MELLYAYVEKYRIFEKQEFRFSDRFIVNYDPETNHLDITPNEEYFDIYPGNIVGVSAIVGKNASGKTTLLSLLGDKPEDRELTDNYDIKTPIHYFLIYHRGKNKNNEDVFVLETNDPQYYKEILDLSDAIIASKVQEADEKALIPLPFVIQENTPIYLESLDNDRNLECVDLEFCGYGLVSFKKDYITEDYGETSYRKWFSTRLYASLQSYYLSDAVELLVDQMNKPVKRRRLYDRKSYVLQLTYNFQPLEQKVAGRDSWELLWSENLPSWKKLRKSIGENLATIGSGFGSIELDFLDRYMMYISRHLRNYAAHGILSEKNGLDRLDENLNHIDTEQNIKEQYVIAIKYLRECYIQLKNSNTNYSDEFIMSYSVEKFTELVEQLEERAKHIKRSSRNIIAQYEITAHTEIDEFFSFLDDIAFSPFLGKHLKLELEPLSDGQRENLGLFASIHKVIGVDDHDKIYYTLLFDEIERCMHPEMCRCLVRDLIKFLQGYPGKQFQIIIASHSPFIVGDIRKEDLICLTDGGKVQKPENLPESFGQNIHTLLKSQFFLDNTFSQYAVDLIKLVSECLKMDSLGKMRKEIRSRLGCGEQDDFNKQLSMIANDSKRLPETDGETLTFLRRIIDSIGEPLLRRSLQAQLRKWEQEPLTLDEEIRLLERRLEELRKQRDNNG